MSGYDDDYSDAALKLHGLLSEVRRAPKDGRDFALFERGDELGKLGIGYDQINAFDATDDAALDHHIAAAASAARAPKRKGEDRDVVVTGASFRPSPGIPDLETLRRKQAEFSGRPVGSQPSAGPGGLYGDVGFGIGPGFNLHVDRESITPSVGAGLFGTAKLGYATNIEALRGARDNNRVFGGVTLDGVPVGGEVRYKNTPDGPRYAGWGVNGGPAQIGAVGNDVSGGVRRGGVSLSTVPGKTYELGFEGGLGIMEP
jgi:hypothetical protein